MHILSKKRSPKTTAKLIQNNVYCFFITIFRLSNLHWRPPLHNGHFFAPADSPYVDSWLSLQWQRPLKRVPNCPIPIGTLRSDDGDGNSTKAIGLISKTTISHVHHAFLYISLPSMHDYDAKMFNFTLYRGSAQATTKFPLTFCTWLWFLEIQL